MAELKPGDTVPTDCTAVGKLPVRMLTSTDGALAYATGTGVTSIGKLLMSSREQDYRDAFAANNLTICDDDELGYDFCAASAPLRLPLKSAADKLQVLLIGMVYGFGGSPPYLPNTQQGVLHAICSAALTNMMAVVTKGERKILFYGELATLGYPTIEDMIAVHFADVDFTGWSVHGVSLNPISETDIAAYKAAITDPSVSILVDMLQHRNIDPVYVDYDVATVMNSITTELRAHVEAGGGWIAGVCGYNISGIYTDEDFDPDYYTGVEPITTLFTGDRYKLPLLYDFSWFPVIFPGLEVISTAFVFDPDDSPGYINTTEHTPTSLTEDGVRLLSPLAADSLYVPDFEPEPGIGYYSDLDTYLHFQGDLNGMLALGNAIVPTGRSPSGAFASVCLIGGVPSFSALA